MISLLRTKVRALRATLSSMRYKKWATRDIFEEIYAKGIWGREAKRDGQFLSGSGSSTIPSEPYVYLIRDYIQQNGIKSVVDLGCGDFRVGKQICEGLVFSYLGIDIVRPLISLLNTNFANQNVRFVCLDIIEDEFPSADLYLIRQVLQHLSNAQITTILKKLDGKTLLVTEHIPTESIIHNRDKATGPDIRLYRRSGVFLEHTPFSRELETLLEVPQPFNGINAVLRTSLIRRA